MAVEDRNINEKNAGILNILSKNARATPGDIARQVDLAPSAVLERIRKLEGRKVIRGYTAEVDPVAIGQGMLAFVAVRSEEGPADDSVAQQLAAFPEIL